MWSRAAWFVLLSVAAGCAGRAPLAPSAPAAPTPVASASSAAAPSPAAERPVRERPEWDTYLAAERVSGTIAIYDTADGSLSCSNVALCKRPMIPASTFKIANSMIGLETGVVDDAESVLPWDGQVYPVAAWNQDLTLRAAIRVSCVPCYRAIARKVGAERMQDWLNRLDYGNHDMSGGVDKFWLSGGLRVTALQQIDFLRRFAEEKLPISKRTQEIVRDIITLDVGPSHALLGKTGFNSPPEFPEYTAWFVGFVELSARRVYFATLITGTEAGVDALPLRRRVTEALLRALQVLPADATRSSE